jgi:hypothetical protein
MIRWLRTLTVTQGNRHCLFPCVTLEAEVVDSGHSEKEFRLCDFVQAVTGLTTGVTTSNRVGYIVSSIPPGFHPQESRVLEHGLLAVIHS